MVHCNTLIFRKKIKTCQVNAFHINSNRKFSNNLIGCIPWHAYFYFLALGQFRFSKDSKLFLNSYLDLFYLSFVQKPWFKFKYLNQFSKFLDLKSPQKVYLNYTSLNTVPIQFKTFGFKLKTLNQIQKLFLQTFIFKLRFWPSPSAHHPAHPAFVPTSRPSPSPPSSHPLPPTCTAPPPGLRHLLRRAPPHLARLPVTPSFPLLETAASSPPLPFYSGNRRSTPNCPKRPEH
jgi:hypothetical protein